MEKAVFLDRDGVLNYDSPDYVFEASKYKIYDDMPGSLEQLKRSGFKLIVITNQAGISRGIYTRSQMKECHAKLVRLSNNLIDEILYSPYHPTVSKSLSRKPGTLLFERAVSKFNIDPMTSWMIGDKQSDLDPAIKLNMKTIGMQRRRELKSDFIVRSLSEAVKLITENTDR